MYDVYCIMHVFSGVLLPHSTAHTQPLGAMRAPESPILLCTTILSNVGERGGRVPLVLAVEP